MILKNQIWELLDYKIIKKILPIMQRDIFPLVVLRER